MKDTKLVNDLITEALAIEAQEAKEAGALGYMARVLILATMPHSKVQGNEFVRKNGTYTLSMLAPSKVGLPYGSLPRLLLSWLTTEAVRTHERELVLGDSLSEFMRELEIAPTGGRWGSIPRLKAQMERLFSCFISFAYTDQETSAGNNVNLVDDYQLWWQPKDPEQAALWNSTVTLSERFFQEITENPVPVDLRAIKALRKSPMALDIYNWLTYRNCFLKRPTLIPWTALMEQFGAEYERVRDFKSNYLDQLKKVLQIYPQANVISDKKGLILKPSPTHVLKKAK